MIPFFDLHIPPSSIFMVWETKTEFRIGKVTKTNMNWKQKSSKQLLSSPSTSQTPSSPIVVIEESKVLSEIANLNTLSIRYNKFKSILETPIIDIEQLKKLSWSGIPDEIRPMVWKILMGYLPTNSDRREATLSRKRSEYNEYTNQSKIDIDGGLQHQIHIDVLRTNNGVPLYNNDLVKSGLERILYCWAVRHPASGYVQGINDLVTPFYQVFLSSYINIEDVDKINSLDSDILKNVEADCFWCLTKLLDGIMDNYTASQPGIQRHVQKLKDLIYRIDGFFE